MAEAACCASPASSSRRARLAAPSGAGGLLVASMKIDAAAEAEFNEWYNAEHLPQLGAVPGVLCARRYSSSATDRERSIWRCIT